MGILVPTALLAILTAALTVAVGSGRLGPNSMMGIRTMATQRSAEAWRAAHKAAGRLLVPANAAILLGCILVLTGATAKVGRAEVLGAILLGLQAVAIIVSAFIAQHAANNVIDANFFKAHP